jgi:hypothetical protein
MSKATKAGSPTLERQVVEPRSTLSVEANNFSIEHGASLALAVERRAQAPEPGEHIGLARDELWSLRSDGEQRPEAVVL